MPNNKGASRADDKGKLMGESLGRRINVTSEPLVGEHREGDKEYMGKGSVNNDNDFGFYSE